MHKEFGLLFTAYLLIQEECMVAQILVVHELKYAVIAMKPDFNYCILIMSRKIS
jgi:hypothetical protein